MSLRTRTLSIALAGALALAAPSCGGGDDDPVARPDPGDLAIKFRNEISMTPAQADCSARVLVDSDLSDATLSDVYRSRLDSSNPDIFADADLDDTERDVIGDIAEDLGACVGVAPSSSVPTAAPEPADPTTGPETEPTGEDLPGTSADG